MRLHDVHVDTPGAAGMSWRATKRLRSKQCRSLTELCEEQSELSSACLMLLAVLLLLLLARALIVGVGRVLRLTAGVGV